MLIMRNLFTRSYDAIMSWARTKHAVSMLSTVSFVESFIFPIPPDLFLIPLSISNPGKLIILLCLQQSFRFLAGLSATLLVFFSQIYF